MSSGYERYRNKVILVVIIMVMKPIRLLCQMFLLSFLDLTVHNVQ